MAARLVVIVGWAALACLAGGALYGIGEALTTRQRRRRDGAAELTEAQRQRLGCAGCLPVLLVIALGVLGRLPGTGALGGFAPAIPRALLLMIGLAFLGLCLTPAVALGIWRARSPNLFAEAGSVVTVLLIVSALAGGVAGGVLGLVLGFVL